MSDRTNADVIAPLHAAAKVLAEEQAWLVGGAVRDALLGRDHPDYDLAIGCAAERPARDLAKAANGFAFSLSDEFGAWRVAARDHSWQIDLTPLMGANLEQDLRRRDLTINAIAQPLTPGLMPGIGALIDPCGGVLDIGAMRLRAVSQSSFKRDPLRILRLARLAAQLPPDFAIDEDTVKLAKRSAKTLTQTAAERVFTELSQILSSSRAVFGIEALATLGALQIVLPEVEAMRGVGQNIYHDRDVYGHTLAVLESVIELEGDAFGLLGDRSAELRALFAAPFANELTRGQALRWGALLHDIAKPQTRAETPDGRVSFLGHDEVGARVGKEILTRLRASERLCSQIAALTRSHLRLGFLVHQQPLSRRDLYAYLAACDSVAVDVTVLSVCDRLATRGRNAEAAIAAHLELARAVIGDALDWEAQPPTAPIRGDVLADALGIEPGPPLRPLLAALSEAAYVGEISAADEPGVVAYARKLQAV